MANGRLDRRGRSVGSAGLLLLAGCTSLLPQGANEEDFVCQIICRLADGSLQGGESVSYESIDGSVEAAQFACEAQIDESPALLQDNCPAGSTPAECSCYEDD